MSQTIAAEQGRVLVVGEDCGQRSRLAGMLSSGNEYHILQASDDAEARRVLSETRIDVVIFDASLSRPPTEEILCWSREHGPDPAWIVISGHKSAAQAASSDEPGVFGVVAPGPESDVIVTALVRPVMQLRRQSDEARRLMSLVDQQNVRLRKQAATLDALVAAASLLKHMIPEPPRVPGLEIGALWAPAAEIGGDFYDFIQLPAGNLGLAIGDVIGSGCRAAMLMSAIRFSLRAHASDLYDMSEVMRSVNRDLLAVACPHDFASVFYGTLDCRNWLLTYENAGHCPPMLVRAGRVLLLSDHGSMLGIGAEPGCPMARTTLQPGDLLVAYTDGISEARAPSGDVFGLPRIEQTVCRWVDRSDAAQVIPAKLHCATEEFVGSKDGMDDLAAWAIRILPEAAG